MNHFIFVILLLFLTIKMSMAQNNQEYFHKNNYFDVAFSAANNKFSEAVSWSHLHLIGNKNHLKIGYGLHFTNYNARNENYTTAPAKLTSSKQNLGTIFSPNIVENIDTLSIPSTHTNFLNLSIHLQYSIKKIDINFNIDAAGFSFGNKPTGMYKINSSSTSSGNLYAHDQKISATVYNVLLTSDNDIGSLNSELTIRYWINDKLAIRAGYCFLFSEYTTDHKLRLENNRFRYKSRMVLIGITYSPFHN